MDLKIINAVTIITIIYSGAFLSGKALGNDDVVNLQVNLASTRSLASNSTTVFRIQGLSDSISFVLFQVHTQNTKITVSLQREPKRGLTAVGSSIGAVAMVTEQTAVNFYVNSSRATKAVVMAITYENRHPIPGGCNSEFALKLDPNLHLSLNKDEVTVSFQYAEFGKDQGDKEGDRCESKPFQSRLTYEVYQYFLPSGDWSEDVYLETAANFLTTASIGQSATKVKTIEYAKGQTRVRFAAYPGQGVMFGVVVRERYLDNSTFEAAYVPVSTYTCQFDNDSGCQNMNDLPLQIILCVLGAFGLILCFGGHHFFKFSMFTFGMLATGLVSYILLSRFAGLMFDLVLVLTGVCGVVGGLFWLTLWCFVGVPVISVLLAGLVAGFIVSAAAFNLTPLGQLDIFTSDFNYGMSFSCGILVVPVFMLAFTKKLSLFSCTLVGSYLVTAAIDSFVKSYISFVVLNAVRKGAVEGFVKTIATTPIQLPGVLLLVVWGVLVLFGLIVQTYSSRDKPDFPACPWDRYKERQQRQRQMEQLASRQQNEERRPLIGPRNRGRGYGSRTPSAPQFQETPPTDGYHNMVDPL